MREVVRNMGLAQFGITHLADVESTSGALSFGVPYRKPPTDTRALCGAHIRDGVVMQEGTKVRCSACRYLNSKES